MAEINLIPYKIKDKRAKIFRIRQYIAIAMLVLCLLYAGIYVPTLYVNPLKSQENALRVKANKSAAEIQKNKVLTQQENELKKRLDVLEAVSKQKKFVSKRLTELEGLVPGDVVFKSIDYTKDNVSITASTNDYNSIAVFGANLQSSSNYSSARIENITYDENSKSYSFSIKIDY